VRPGRYRSNAALSLVTEFPIAQTVKAA